MHEKVGIFLNPTVQERYKRQAVTLSRKVPNSVLHELAFPVKLIPDEETVVVFGGDGSAKGVVEAMLNRDNPGLFLVVPAGSHNGFYASLKDAASTVNLDQLRDNATNHIPNFRPGSINGEIFNHLADLTRAGVIHLKYTEAVRRFVPRGMRGFVGFAIGFAKIEGEKDYPVYEFKLLMTGPNIGKYRLPLSQNIYDNNITLVSMEAKSKIEGLRKLIALLLYLKAGEVPPEKVAKILKEESFNLKVSYPEINVDGELRTLPKSDTIFISRKNKCLQAAALVF